MNPIKKCDIYVVIIMVLVIGIHFMTNFFIEKKSEVTGAEIESVIKIYETNPFKHIQLKAKGLLTMLLYFVNPGFILFFYWLIRQSVKKGKTEVIILQSFTMLVFFITMVNFLNDFGMIAGMLARGI